MKKKSRIIWQYSFFALIHLLAVINDISWFATRGDWNQYMIISATIILVIFITPNLIALYFFNPATWLYMRNPKDPDKSPDYDITTVNRPKEYPHRLFLVLLIIQIIAFLGLNVMTIVSIKVVYVHEFVLFPLLVLGIFPPFIYGSNKNFFIKRKCIIATREMEEYLKEHHHHSS
jgi:hypothetical protein